MIHKELNIAVLRKLDYKKHRRQFNETYREMHAQNEKFSKS